MKFLILVLIFSSCNLIKTLTGGETKIDNEFYNTQKEESLFHGLVAYYRLDEASGNRDDIWGDYPLDANGVLGNSDGADCASGGSGPYKLKNDVLALDLDSSITISFWISMHALNSTSGQVLGLQAGNLFNIKIGDIGTQGDSLENIEIYANSSTEQIDNIIDSTDPHHITLVMYNNANTIYYKLFVDGVIYNDNNFGWSSISLDNFSLCSDSAGTTNVNARIAGVGVWNRSLDPDEIERLYWGVPGLDYD